MKEEQQKYVAKIKNSDGRKWDLKIYGKSVEDATKVAERYCTQYDYNDIAVKEKLRPDVDFEILEVKEIEE